ncbi:MAG: thiamine monophosphate synthase [Firmicutes bacterium]|nr:thiamine monophosphate synthase [Bacillota bacterium]
MVIYVTNRKLCRDDFLDRIDSLAKKKPHAIMLREKDLEPVEYESLAGKVKEICEKNGVRLIVNGCMVAASKLGIPCIHLSMADLRLHAAGLACFKSVGASVHTASEAREAQDLGASYLIAGHIFPTDCKKGVPPRGLSFLEEVCGSVTVPVFAIGGITKDRMEAVMGTGAKGICLMSEAMTCRNIP